MEALWRDLQVAARSLARQPGFTAVVIITLALGVGANTAIFSFVYAILLRPFSYPEPQQLVRLYSISLKEGGRESGSSLIDVEDWNRDSRTLVAAGAYVEFDTDVRGDGVAQAVRICQLHATALQAVGVAPIMGRLFTPDEDRPGGDVHKAIISHGLWQRRYGSDPNILGKAVETPLTRLTIVGVMPPGFGFPDRAEVWTPMESWYAIQVGPRREKLRHQRWYRVVARLKPGVSMSDADSELNAMAADLEQRYPKDNAGIRIRLRPVRDAETGDLRPYLLLVSSAAGFLLLICCVNVAGLLLSRAVSVRHEFSLCAALGASRVRLMQRSLAESMLLALAGGALGTAMAYASQRILLGLIPVALPAWMRIEVDWPVLGFALVACLLTIVLFGLVPALFVSRANLGFALREGSRTTAGGGSRLRSALVIAEVSLTLLLLVGAGLMLRTFSLLRNQETGFRSQDLLVARATNYRSGSRAERAVALSQFHERVLNRLSALPGVLSVAGTNSLPYTRTAPHRTPAPLRVKGQNNEESKLTLPLSGADVSPGFFETMHIPVLQGRTIDSRDTPDSPMVVLVNERAAKVLWPDRDPIGQELFWGADEPSAENPYCRVVGVVGNVRHLAGEADDGLELYYPYTQYPITNIYYVLRTRGGPVALASSVRQAIHDVDRNAGIVFVKSMENLIDDSLWQRRLWSVLLTAFGALSLALAAVGLYGLLSYLVSQRIREIGVRLALGAAPQNIQLLILAHGTRLLALGAVLGILAAVALQRLLSGLLFGVSPTDAITMVAASALLAGVALLACYLPARRACRVNPVIALRHE